jgi:hypothetical protein
MSLRRYGWPARPPATSERQDRNGHRCCASPGAQLSRSAYDQTVEHSSGISPAAVMFLCFIVVGVGVWIAVSFDKNKKK